MLAKWPSLSRKWYASRGVAARELLVVERSQDRSQEFVCLFRHFLRSWSRQVVIPERCWQVWLNPCGLRVGFGKMNQKLQKLGLVGFKGLHPGAGQLFAVDEDSTFIVPNQRVDAWGLMSFSVIGTICHIIAVIGRDQVFHSPSFPLF